VCNEDLGIYDKAIIDDEVQKILMKSKKICWKNIIRELYRFICDKLYSENKVKNYWNSKHRISKKTKDIKSDEKKANEKPKMKYEYPEDKKQNA
jgi:hypothetical protein